MHRARDRHGFTLLEVLVATFILIVIVLILSQVYHQVSLSWASGMRRATGNMSGRSTVGFMAREMMNAVADRAILRDGLVQHGYKTIGFITLDGDKSGKRIARLIRYELDGTSIKRTQQYKDTAGGTYTNGGWATPNADDEWILATNIASLFFYTPDKDNYGPGTTHPGTLPAWVRMKVTINRAADVSGVGASSLGPDGKSNTPAEKADDIVSW